MKFRKKDLSKIIDILTKKQEELKHIDDNDIIEYNSQFKIDQFKIPEKFYIKGSNKKEAEIIYKFIETQIITDGVTNIADSWRNCNAGETHYLYIKNTINGYEYDCGSISIVTGFQRINFNDFIKYIVNEK